MIGYEGIAAVAADVMLPPMVKAKMEKPNFPSVCKDVSCRIHNKTIIRIYHIAGRSTSVTYDFSGRTLAVRRVQYEKELRFAPMY